MYTAEYLREKWQEKVAQHVNKNSNVLYSVWSDTLMKDGKKFRRTRREYKATVIKYGCSVHLLHLLAQDLSVPEIKTNVIEIAKYFCNNHFAVAVL